MQNRMTLLIPFILGISGGSLIAIILKRALLPMKGSRVTYMQHYLWRILGLQKEIDAVRKEEAKKRKRLWISLAKQFGRVMGQYQASVRRDGLLLSLQAAQMLNGNSVDVEDRLKYTFWARRAQALRRELQLQINTLKEQQQQEEDGNSQN